MDTDTEIRDPNTDVSWHVNPQYAPAGKHAEGRKGHKTRTLVARRKKNKTAARNRRKNRK